MGGFKPVLVRAVLEVIIVVDILLILFGGENDLPPHPLNEALNCGDETLEKRFLVVKGDVLDRVAKVDPLVVNCRRHSETSIQVAEERMENLFFV